MTRRRIYATIEEAKKANADRALARMKRLYTEDAEFKKKVQETSKSRYTTKNQEIQNLKAELQAIKNSIIID